MKRNLSLLSSRYMREHLTNYKRYQDSKYTQGLDSYTEPQGSYYLPRFFVLVCLCLLLSVPTLAYGDNHMGIEAKAALLMEPTTGVVLYEHNAHEPLAPASVTKVMTMLLIYEAVDSGKISWDDPVTISEHAANMGGSQIFLEAGQTQHVRDLTKSISIASANDAAVAMAEHIAGSEEGFVTLMNQRAAALGMTNTTFKNACGLDAPGHVTTAYDIALMSGALITQFPEVSETALIWMDDITHTTRRGSETFGLTNTNKMIRSYTGITGLKTGSTGMAKFCMSATAQREGMALVSVILGADTGKIRFREAGRLLDYGYANYGILQGEPVGTPKGLVTIHKGVADEVEIVVAGQVNALINKGDSTELTSVIETVEAVVAPVTAGSKAGEIIYLQNNQEVGRADLVVSMDVAKAGLGYMIQKLFRNWH